MSDGGNGKRALTAVTAAEATEATEDGSRAVAHADRPPALVGVAIPGRDRTIRRMVVQLYQENPHLPSAARGVVSNYCKAVRAAERVYQRWQGTDFEPGRDADLFMRATAEARHHASVLGLTPVSMASLGVDITRMRKLVGDDGGDGADVEELEQRILARLQMPTTVAEEPQRREQP